MELYLKSGSNFQENGTETIEGKETVRYDGVITNECFNEVFTSTGVLDQFSSLGVDAETAQSMLTDLGDLPISVWVEKESNLPVKYEMDMTAIMQSIMTKTMEAADSTAVSYTHLQTAWPYLVGSALGGVAAGVFGRKVSTNLLHRILGILILWGGIRSFL